MTNPRLEFALERMGSGDWRSFEQFAAEFLASEFPALRTTASASGDGGRDGELFVLDGDVRTGFQYSVRADWKQKITETVDRLSETFPSVTRIIYATNQVVGALADDLKKQIWDDAGVQIDVRDRSWFSERETSSATRSTASAELIRGFAEPYLQSREIVRAISTPLDREDSKIALLQLSMNARDNETERGLTKTSFEALVNVALTDTSADNTRSLSEIQAAVHDLVPSGAPGQVDALVVSALARLSRRGGPVKYRTDRDGYHISFDAAEAWKTRAATYLLDQEALEAELASKISELPKMQNRELSEIEEAAIELRGVIESVLMKRGEAFVGSVEKGTAILLSEEEIAAEIADLDTPPSIGDRETAAIVLELFSQGSGQSKAHLARVLDAYTLFAFLQQTPDVQKSLSRVFSEGDIWLDATAILPLLGELLLDDDEERSYTCILRAARTSGIQLWVTDGIIEEVERHLNLCLSFLSIPASEWEGRTPFVYASYVLSGRAPSEFPAWVSEIRGTAQPKRDVEEFLDYTFGIKKKNLRDYSENADIALRGAAQELWMEAHDHRRANSVRPLDSGTVSRLVEHDVENAVGIIELRRSTPDSPLGYRAWWLTFDNTAYRLGAALKDALGPDAPPSPVLSPEYLSQMLRFGPLRNDLGAERLAKLPLAANLGWIENVPRELIDLATKTREEFEDFSELRIRREVRDALDRARATLPRAEIDGTQAVTDRIKIQSDRNRSGSS